jgi:hypothetical protein
MRETTKTTTAAAATITTNVNKTKREDATKAKREMKEE